MAGSLKHIKNRIGSVKSTQKITNAMNVVSAAKFKKAKEQLANSFEYYNILSEIIYDIAIDHHNIKLSALERKFFGENKLNNKAKLFIIMTSERGLCGSFNYNIIKQVKYDIAQLKKDKKNIKLIVIGKYGIDLLQKQYSDIVDSCYCSSKGHTEFIASAVKTKIITMVENDEIGACYVYYNKHKNALTQILAKDRILPANYTQTQRKCSTISEYEYEGVNFVRDAISLYINSQIHYGLLQSKTSEEASRMTAMDNATKNANELIDKLTLEFNRSRQSMITTELIEIISGAEAVRQ